MRTIQIFLQLIDTITRNPSAAAMIPWDDIKLCISTELEYRSGLYSPDRFTRVNRLFTDLSDNAAADSHSAAAVISTLEKLVFALQVLPDAEYTDELLAQLHFNRACLNHYRNNTIIVLGDSHVNFFSGNETLSFLSIGNDINTCAGSSPYPFTPLHLGPCLAYTCRRPDSTFRFQEKVAYLCRNFIKPGARILCCLGEIDLRVHVFRQTVIQDRSYQQIVDDILAEYMGFLISLQDKGYQVSCWGPIASQKEDCPADPYFPRNGTETERNMATAYFNRQLAILCSRHNIPFLSLFEQLITPDYRTLAQYLSADCCHLSQRALPLALREWESILFHNPQQAG